MSSIFTGSFCSGKTFFLLTFQIIEKRIDSKSRKGERGFDSGGLFYSYLVVEVDTYFKVCSTVCKAEGIH